MLRKIADNLYKGDFESYLKECKFEYFEDTIIYGFIISKFDADRFFSFLPTYLEKVDSWSLIDSFVPSIKCLKKYPERFLEYVKANEKSADGFHLRFLTVTLMPLLSKHTLNYVFEYCSRNDGKGYYNDMAIAWLVSICFVKFRCQTLDFIKNCKLSDFTLKKSVSKINDSFRVSREDKILLQNIIRKK